MHMMKPNNFMMLACAFLMLACHPKSNPQKSKTETQKLEMLAYYQSSGKLGYLVDAVKVENDNLYFNVVYHGGCKPHTFRLICDSLILKSKPVKTNLYLLHENNGDTCHNEIKKELIFDISRLKNLHHHPIQLNIDNLNTVIYEY